MSQGANAVEEKIEKILIELATNTQVTKDILIQTTKTNGRMTVAEQRLNDHDTKFALQEDARGRWKWWVDKFGTASIGLICAAVGFTLLLVLQKAEIIDISVVSAERYNAIIQQTEWV